MLRNRLKPCLLAFLLLLAACSSALEISSETRAHMIAV